MILPSIGLGPTMSEFSEAAMPLQWPVPERPAMALNGPVPAPVLGLAHLALAFCWQHRITYARGCWPSVGGRPSRQRDSYAVRMWRGRQRAVAVYVEGPSERAPWAWDTLLEWDLDRFPHGLADITAFQDAVFGPLCKPSWPGPKDWSCPYFGPVHGPDKPKRVRS